MDYEKKHQEDLRAAKGWLAIAKENNNKIAIQILENLFPELKEIEDERIRKALINVFSTHQGYEVFFGASVEDILAWLEKQGQESKKISIEQIK